MSNTRKEFRTPVGRIVAGDLYEVNTKNAEGQPLVIKNGPNAGQPRSEVYFAIAIRKGTEQHWAQTEWGQLIYQVGAGCFPGGQYNAPTFSWKIQDGDSQIPNAKGIKPSSREGYPGHWILNFSSGFKPKIVNNDGSQEIAQEGAVKPGFFVQVFGYVDGNGSVQRPGVFLNHMAVSLQGYGPEIQTRGVDTAAVGFGQGVVLPQGASQVPIGALPGAPGSALPGQPGMPFPGQPGAMPGVPVGFPGMPVPGAQPGYATPPMSPGMPAGLPAGLPIPGQQPMQQPMAYPGQPTALPGQVPMQPVYPNPGMTAVGLPPPGMVPQVPVGRPPQQRMTALAQAPYESYIAQNWNDQMLIQHGLMTAQ